MLKISVADLTRLVFAGFVAKPVGILASAEQLFGALATLSNKGLRITEVH